MENAMRALNAATTLMVARLFATAPVAVAQSGSEQGGKQQTQEGRATTHELCKPPDRS
jgi:hypothetical protein